MRKPLPLSAQLASIVGAALLVLALGYFVAVRPLAHKAAGLHAQTAGVRLQIADDLAQVAAARGAGPAAAAQTIKVADVYKLAKAMPAVTDMPDVLIELDQTARAAGVDLQTLSPGTAAPGTNGYSMLPITLTVAGNFYTVTDLLYRLRNLVYVRSGALQANGRLFSVNSVTLSPSNGKSIAATIAVDTYVYGGTTAAAPPSTTTATTTTTTTPASGPSAAGATP
ncbi:MAG TPA: type 4a pilus biogenesis protein PilO [Gaiellaceae bacterium]|nr:type 4a pilus biogenesis protein PilO [Gaiellaceae bacterium]